jgi:hypothetical protein
MGPSADIVFASDAFRTVTDPIKMAVQCTDIGKAVIRQFRWLSALYLEHITSKPQAFLTRRRKIAEPFIP